MLTSASGQPLPHERKSSSKGYNYLLPSIDAGLQPRMGEYLRRRSLCVRTSHHNLWYPSSDAGDTEPRIVIPATSQLAHNKFWQARYIGVDASVPRYQSPYSDRGDALVIMYPISKEDNRIVVVTEGPMCALAAAALGFVSVALMGIAPTQDALMHLRDYVKGRTLRMIADADQTHGMAKVMLRLHAVGCRAPCEILTTYPSKDLADATLADRERILGIS